VAAWTSVGPGKPKVATIQSGVEPVLPEPPTKLALSNIDAFSIVLQFTPGFDGNSSITKWTVQVSQSIINAPFEKVEDYYSDFFVCNKIFATDKNFVDIKIFLY